MCVDNHGFTLSLMEFLARRGVCVDNHGFTLSVMEYLSRRGSVC